MPSIDLARLTAAELERYRDEIAASLAEERLSKYTRLLWSVIEPGRKLIGGWAMDAIDEHLEAVTAGQIRWLLINVPPGFRKSLETCVFWPSWEWGPQRRPDLRYGFIGYRGALTLPNNRKLRQLVESDTYRRLWPHVQIVDDQNTKIFFETTATGSAFATSIGGTVMGKRWDRWVLDDPNSTKETESEAKLDEARQFVTEVLPTRVNDPRTAAGVTIMQRTGERDVAGLLIESGLIDCHLCIPMEWRKGHPYIHYPDRCTAIGWCDPRTEDGELAFPERFPREEVEQLKRRLTAEGGDYAVASQLDQLPIPRGGGMFQEEWLSRLIEPDEVPRGGVTVRGWDLAATASARSAFTASVKMRLVGGTVYVLDVTNERIDAAAVEDHIVSVSLADDPDTIIDVPQDPGPSAKIVVTSWARRFHGRTYLYSPEGKDKETRAMPFAAQCRAGNVVLVRGDWNRAYVMQAKSFPRGMYKDMIDATSRAYARLTRARQSRPVGGKLVAL